MGFNCGIVGLPNVGKSTLFNALTATAAAQAANYPFCTIEPNVGRVGVPDPRLDTLAAIGKSAKIVPTSLEFVDIAGLVRGASKGEGLGNQFLANIREVDAIIHVLRCFEDSDITHVEGRIDPLRDVEVVETELMLADLDSLEKRLIAAQKTGARRRQGKHRARSRSWSRWSRRCRKAGRRATRDPAGEEEAVKRLQLLTSKPVLYVCNVEEGVGGDRQRVLRRGCEARARAEGARVVVMSAAIEAEVAQLPEADRGEFLEGLGLHDSGLDRVIRAGYDLLGLVTYLHRADRRRRAPGRSSRGTKAPQAAGSDPQDFERGFIACETIAYDDYRRLQGRAGRQGGRQDAGRGQGVRREGRRRAAVPLQRVTLPLRPGAERVGARWGCWRYPASRQTLRRPPPHPDPLRPRGRRGKSAGKNHSSLASSVISAFSTFDTGQLAFAPPPAPGTSQHRYRARGRAASGAPRRSSSRRPPAPWSASPRCAGCRADGPRR